MTHAFGRIDVPLVFWSEEWCKKWDALDVVPVRMTDKYVTLQVALRVGEQSLP